MSKYRDKVFSFLKSLKEGKIVSLDSIVKKENVALFIETVKEYIDEFGDVEFNQDYSSIKKLSSSVNVEVYKTREEVNLKIDNPEKLKVVNLIIDKCSKIIDPEKFIISHSNICNSQSKNPRYKPYYDRIAKTTNK